MKETHSRIYQEASLPPGTELEFGGLHQIQQESCSGLLKVLLTSMVLIFIILVFELRSFSHPIAILIGTVLCTSGSSLALFVMHTTLNISSFMGIIMVIGIVHKDGILMLDSEGHYTAQGWNFVTRYHAGERRLRPIMMKPLPRSVGCYRSRLVWDRALSYCSLLPSPSSGDVMISMILSLAVNSVFFYSLQ